MSVKNLHRIGPAALEALLRADTLVRAASAARKAGIISVRRGYRGLAEAMIAEVGLERAFDITCRFFVGTIMQDPDLGAEFDDAREQGRGPRRDLQADPLKLLFRWSGRPTLLGAAVLRWANADAGHRAVKTSVASPRPAASDGKPTVRKLPRNRSMILPYADLTQGSLARIDKLLAHTPLYGATEFKRLIGNTIGAIHQIPKLYRRESGRRVELKQIEVYFGRSSGHARNVSQRLLAGRKRGHTYGMVFARCSVKATLSYERHGILLLDVLRESDGLCISNRSMKAVGKVGASEPGFLYMTFRILDELEEAPAWKLSREDIRGIVDDYQGDIKKIAGDAGTKPAALKSAFALGLRKANDPADFGAYKLACHDD